MRVLISPPIEQDFRLGVRLVVAVAVGDEHQVRRGPDPDAAEADLQSTDEVQSLDEHLTIVKLVVSVGVLENDNAVAPPALRLAARVAVRLGHPHPTAMIEREGDRLHHVRLGGGSDGAEAGRQCHRPRRGLGCGALEQQLFKNLRNRRLHGVGEAGALGIKAEVVKVDVAPAAGVFVDDADENRLARVRAEIHHRWPHRLAVLAADLENHLPAVRPHHLHARLRVAAAADAERRKRMRHLEHRAGQRAGRLVKQFLVAAQPIIPLRLGHLAFAELAIGIDLAPDRLALPRLALGCPIGERAFFKIKIQRLAILALGQHALGQGRRREALGLRLGVLGCIYFARGVQ